MTSPEIPAIVTNPTYLYRCTLERLGDDPRIVDMGDGQEIHFIKRTNGQHLALVSNPAHAKRLNAIPEAYEVLGIVPQETPAAKPGAVGAAAPAAQPLPKPEPQPEPADASTLTPDATRAALVAEDPVDEANPEHLLTIGSVTIEEAREIYEREIGNRPHPSAKLETLVARINEHRAARQPA